MKKNIFSSFFFQQWTKSWILRFSFRAIAAIFFLKFAAEALAVFFETKSINYFLLVVSELVSVGLLVAAKDSIDVKMSPLAVFSTICGTFYYLLMDFFEYSSINLVSSDFGALLQSIGILLQIYSKLSLGRSFGLLPANRGVVDHGAYRFVRHPIYASYMVGHIGFILSAFNFWNLSVLIFAYIFQFIRIKEEESVLKKDADYLAYSRRVKWRIVPLIF